MPLMHLHQFSVIYDSVIQGVDVHSVNPISHGLSDSVAPTGGGHSGPPLKVLEGAIFERGHGNRK